MPMSWVIPACILVLAGGADAFLPAPAHVATRQRELRSMRLRAGGGEGALRASVDGGGMRRKAGERFADVLWVGGGDVGADHAKAGVGRGGGGDGTGPVELEDTYKRVTIFARIRKWLSRGKDNGIHHMYNISETEYGSLRNHHFIQMRAEDVHIDVNRAIGDGSYGMVFHGRYLGEEHKGLHIVAKRAKDWEGREPAQGSLTNSQLEERLEHFEQLGTAGRAGADLAVKYLEVEAYMNDLIMEVCPRAAAPYLGMALVNRSRWLVWEYIGRDTLEDVLQACNDCQSLKPLAKAIGVNDFEDEDATSLQRLCDVLSIQLLECLVALEKAGVAHRDIKPLNLLACGGRVMLIDFGSAAAMGIKGRVGYDWEKCPCDPRYAPPEQFIDEIEWSKYDLYCVGLILVRVLFPALWDGQHFDSFSDSYHNAKYDLDEWLQRLMVSDKTLAAATGVPRVRMAPMVGTQEVTRDDLYVSLAEQSCSVEDGKMALTLCGMKLGFEMLNHEGPGVCWGLLRRMLAQHPAERISPAEALDAIRAGAAGVNQYV